MEVSRREEGDPGRGRLLMPKTPAERQAALAERQRAAGRVQRKVWASPEDWPAIRAFVENLNRARERVLMALQRRDP